MFYARCLGGEPKVVIYLGPLTSTSSSTDPFRPWLFNLYPHPYKLLPLINWLQREEPRPCKMTCPSAHVLRSLLVGDGKLKKPHAFLRQLRVPREFFADDPATFYFSLLRLTASEPGMMHDIEKELSSRLYKGETSGEYEQDAKGITEHHQMQLFLQDCLALRRSLVSRPPQANQIAGDVPLGARTAPDEKTGRILLIDDDPMFQSIDRESHSIPAVLAEIRRVLLPQFDFKVWNPGRGRRDSAFEYLLRYRSLDGNPESAKSRKIRLNDLDQPSGKNVHLSLSDALCSARFILVDQLYKGPSEDKFLGPEVIRGINRLVRDLRFSNGSCVERTALPEIIAVSRTSDTARIQEALRAGAQDYVLKSNLLELPAVLGGLLETTAEPAPSLQQNFRKSYQLPNDVIGLLRAVRVPRVHWNEWCNWDEQHLPIHIRTMRDILRAIPKTDLHVHLGSCMTPEFLVTASLLGLVMEMKLDRPPNQFKEIVELISRYKGVIDHDAPRPATQVTLEWEENIFMFKHNVTGACSMELLSRWVKEEIKTQLEDFEKPGQSSREKNSSLRSILHKDLEISDYLDHDETLRALERKSYMEVAHFAIQHAGIKSGKDRIRPLDAEVKGWLTYPQFIRIYLLCLASDGSKLRFNYPRQDQKLVGARAEGWFKTRPKAPEEDAWRSLYNFLYKTWSVARFKEVGWDVSAIPLSGREPLSDSAGLKISLTPKASQRIRDALATGRTSQNLDEYLEGCELSGAEHLKHPLLIHLYAQHLMPWLMKNGILYAELRASPDGYENDRIQFSFSDVCKRLIQAFNGAQKQVVEALREPGKPGIRNRRKIAKQWLPQVFFKTDSYSLDSLFAGSGLNNTELSGAIGSLANRFPPKVGLLFVGKRHKSTVQMILEAAASAVFHQREKAKKGAKGAALMEDLKECRVVGFDLAGRETTHAPSLFGEEFHRLGRLHIPLTVHAGENPPSQLVEDAILELGARRIGHGLALAGDDKLMARVRDERVCIELCPVSNHQTCHFAEPGGAGREYPLRTYVEEGIPACLGTDNPIISDTNIVKEYFQASWAWNEDGMSLWDALRLMKMGFRHAFLSLPERSAFLEAVDQIVFDLFSKAEVRALLEQILDIQKQTRAYVPFS